MVNYHSKKRLLFLGIKYCSNLLSYCSKLLSFQGKFDVINIPMAISSKMAVNYWGICFITFSQMSLSESKCCYSNNCLQFFKRVVPLHRLVFHLDCQDKCRTFQGYRGGHSHRRHGHPQEHQRRHLRPLPAPESARLDRSG